MSPTRILIVDDNEVNLRLAAEVLGDVGYVVTTAPNAEVALAAIRDEEPDLILMDIGLPGMDGLALTQALKSQEATKDIVIVALTAFAMNDDSDRAYAAGCDGYITKPFDTKLLPAQVVDAFKKARAKEGHQANG